jgi:hypothetical protein
MIKGPNMEKLLSGYTDYSKKFYDGEGYIRYFMHNYLIDSSTGLNYGENGFGFNTLYNGENVLEDPYTKYEVNSLGYRTKEFILNEEILYAGCSFSFGTGVPEKYIWGTQVAKHFNKSYTNLSLPGLSPMSIVQNLFAYFNVYGNPKYLFCLFSDMYRLSLPNSVGRLVYGSEVHKHTITDPLAYLHLNNKRDTNDVPTFSKAPHKLEDLITGEITWWLNMKHINMLEQYCKSNKINFVWSLWDQDILETCLVNKNKLFLNSLIDIKMRDWDRDPKTHEDVYFNKDCHSSLKEENESIFNIGGDIVREASSAHWGTHKHTHTAEEFVKYIDKNFKI